VTGFRGKAFVFSVPGRSSRAWPVSPPTPTALLFPLFSISPWQAHAPCSFSLDQAFLSCHFYLALFPFPLIRALPSLPQPFQTKREMDLSHRGFELMFFPLSRLHFLRPLYWNFFTHRPHPAIALPVFPEVIYLLLIRNFFLVRLTSYVSLRGVSTAALFQDAVFLLVFSRQAFTPVNLPPPINIDSSFLANFFLGGSQGFEVAETVVQRGFYKSGCFL